jgi:hypothetical protein
MVKFFRRFIGVLVLDASVYEEIEADTRAGMQSVAIVLAATAAGGFAAMGLGLVGVSGFVAAAITVLGGWLVWVSLIATLGTTRMAEPQTHSSPRELLRTMGFAAAPGVFLGFAAMRSVAPLMFALVSVWMIAAAVMAARQALDFRSLARAVAVCGVSWVLSIGVLVLIATVMARPVE